MDAETDAHQEEESEPHQLTNESTPQSVPIGLIWSEIDAGSRTTPPKNFTQISGRKDATEWLKAYNQDVESLECIGEFDVVQLRDVPVGVKPLPLKELFTIKDSGRKKVRLAVRGDLVKPADDEDNYAPTGHFEIVRLLVSVAASKGWKIRSLGVKNAYLYGKSEKEVYLRLPTGHPKNDGSNCWRTTSSIYGLRSSPRNCNVCIDEFLKKLRFVNCPVDPCLYKRNKMFLCLFVDDILHIGKSNVELDELEQQV
eukprot:maker-scaffold_95-snap-gene-0.28-mRNA-1 protein AED:0.52 eAED:0.54 QI:0/0/0/0.5/1/1/2/0/254